MLFNRFFVEYCLSKADLSDDQHKKYIWHFIKANFKENSRAEILNLLGYKIEDVHDKLNQYVGTGEGKNVESNEPNMTRVSKLLYRTLHRYFYYAIKNSTDRRLR